jgi:hypothetical protein
MTRVSAIQRSDAKRLAPPAAHRARQFLKDTADAVEAIADHADGLCACLEKTPHDKTKILGLIENFKKQAMQLHGHAVTACQTIRRER